MSTTVVLLRGINLGSHNRIAMPALREALSKAGFGNVRTYVASGNVLVESRLKPASVEGNVKQLIAEQFGLEIPVLARSRDELAEVIRRDPFGEQADNPKRYQVSFLDREPDPAVVEKMQGLAHERERLVSIGRELYAWHPDGVARSKLWAGLAGNKLGVTATARNWTTVTKLLEMIDG